MVEKYSTENSAIKPGYYDALKDYGIEGSSDNKSGFANYSGKVRNAAKKVGGALWKHKGKVATVAAEGYSIPFFSNLRGVATNVLVESKLKIGEVIKYPLRVELLPLPHTVDVSGQIQINPTSEYIPVVYEFLKYVGSNPVATAVAAASPVIAYGTYRVIKMVHDHRKNKKAEK